MVNELSSFSVAARNGAAIQRQLSQVPTASPSSSQTPSKPEA